MVAVSYTNSKKELIEIELFTPTITDYDVLFSNVAKTTPVVVDVEYKIAIIACEYCYRFVKNGKSIGHIYMIDKKVAATWDLVNLTATEKFLFMSEISKLHPIMHMAPYGNEWHSFLTLLKRSDVSKFHAGCGYLAIRASYIFGKVKDTAIMLDRLGFKKASEHATS